MWNFHLGYNEKESYPYNGLASTVFIIQLYLERVFLLCLLAIYPRNMLIVNEGFHKRWPGRGNEIKALFC